MVELWRAHIVGVWKKVIDDDGFGYHGHDVHGRDDDFDEEHDIFHERKIVIVKTT